MLNSDWLIPDWERDGAHAFMTTRAGGVSRGAHASMNLGRAVQDDPAAVAENRAILCRALGAPAVFLAQVHGTDVLLLRPEHAEPGVALPKADACVSTTPGLGLAIQVADCLPVLFAAPAGVAGAHAGWRGLAAGVLENTVIALCKEANCRPEDVSAWMGACIGPTAFEVGADVLRAFGREPAPLDAECFRYEPNAAGQPRWRADLPGLARARLQALGLKRLYGGHWCTLSEPERFFSYRHEALAGRMAAAIVLR